MKIMLEGEEERGRGRGKYKNMTQKFIFALT
jgi:hypothetical protein